jgi:hypothetical protein
MSMSKKTPAQLEADIAESLAKAKGAKGGGGSSYKPPSWKQIAEDYKRRAEAAKAEGGKVKRWPDGSILILPVEGADEYFYQDWQADELIDATKRKEKEVLKYISLEDLLLAQSQEW